MSPLSPLYLCPFPPSVHPETTISPCGPSLPAVHCSITHERRSRRLLLLLYRSTMLLRLLYRVPALVLPLEGLMKP